MCFCMQHAPMSSTVSQIERVFTAASHKKVWDHFTKAQRKNIEMWKKQSSVCMYTALPYAGSVSLFSISPPSSLPFPSLLLSLSLSLSISYFSTLFLFHSLKQCYRLRSLVAICSFAPKFFARNHHQSMNTLSSSLFLPPSLSLCLSHVLRIVLLRCHR